MLRRDYESTPSWLLPLVTHGHRRQSNASSLTEVICCTRGRGGHTMACLLLNHLAASSALQATFNVNFVKHEPWEKFQITQLRKAATIEAPYSYQRSPRDRLPLPMDYDNDCQGRVPTEQSRPAEQPFSPDVRSNGQHSTAKSTSE